jgi:hypothetical protein
MMTALAPTNVPATPAKGLARKLLSAIRVGSLRHSMLTFVLLLLQLSGTVGQCTNTCNYAYDGDCDDGGPGNEYNICSLGTDCYDCGPRSQSSPPPPTAGTSSSTGTTASLHSVSTVNGITYYSGAGSSWTVPQHSPLVSYACSYNLCTITAPFDGTASNPLGNSIDFAGPNYQP